MGAHGRGVRPGLWLVLLDGLVDLEVVVPHQKWVSTVFFVRDFCWKQFEKG